MDMDPMGREDPEHSRDSLGVILRDSAIFLVGAVLGMWLGTQCGIKEGWIILVFFFGGGVLARYLTGTLRSKPTE